MDTYKKLKNSKVFHYIFSVFIIAAVAILSTPIANTQNYHVVSYLLLFVVSLLSIFLSVGPVLLASTLSALVWNFFYIPPQHTFHIEKAEDILIFGLFFILVLVNGVLTTRIRKQELVARTREKRASGLFQLTKELSRAGGVEEVLKVAISEIKDHFGLNPFFILQDGNNILYSTGRLQVEKKLNSDEYQIAEWAFKNSQTAGTHTSHEPNAGYTFFPLTGTRMNPGVLAIMLDNPFKDEQKSYWDTFLAQISNALEREFLADLAQKVRFLDESDRLYKALFNSISHEFRIPVATIMGASDSIINSSNSEEIQKALCNEIFTASLRLNRLIENLLNMSRLESGHISVRLDWYDLNDLVNKITEDLKEELKPFVLRVNIPENIPLVKIDFGLMEQVLFNLLFNSALYAPQGSEIVLSTFYSPGELTIMIDDSGPGFPEKELKNVFKKFYRAPGSKTGGLGLGLSIAKGFVEAHKGTIEAENLVPAGARIKIRIPSEMPEINNLHSITNE